MTLTDIHGPTDYEGSVQRLRRNRLSVSLPAVDLPELREAGDAFGAAVVERLDALVSGPLTVGRERPGSWTRLLFGQICGYRYIKQLADVLTPLASPHYQAQGSSGAYVRAAVVVRAQDQAAGLSDLRGHRLVRVERDLNSANLLRAELAPLAGGRAFFSSIQTAGGVAQLLEALCEGEADAAVIDGVAYAHLARLRPRLAGKSRVLAWTAKSPAAPFVMSTALVETYGACAQAALADAIADPALKAAREHLLIRAVGPAERRHYQAAIHFQQIAQTLGYPELR